MIENVYGLRIKGRCFSNETHLTFFCDPRDRISVIYGKNGSGKSTISEGLGCITSNGSTSDLLVSLLDAQNNALSLPEDAGAFVFNEQYIDKNVKIDDDGLGSIILLGGHVDLQAEIDKRLSEVSTFEKECESLQGDCNKYMDPNNPLSPKYHLNRIIAILKQAGGWAETDAKIKSNRRNSPVTNEVIAEICGLAPKLSYKEIKEQFDSNYALLGKIADVATTYPEEIKPIEVDDKWEEIVRKALAAKIDEPILTEREKIILKTIQAGGQSNVERASEDFSLETTIVCPYCFRDIDKDYKKNLIKSIGKVLNKDVDEHKNRLNEIVFPSIVIDLAKYEPLDSILIKRIVTQAQKCQDIIANYKGYVEQKVKNVYTPLAVPHMGLSENVDILNGLLKQLDDKREEFNIAAKAKRSLIDKLLKLNKLMAHLQTAQVYKDYEKQSSEEKSLAEKLEGRQRRLLVARKELQELEQQKSNIGLAIKNINSALDYVFFEQGRLSIELKKDKYYLKAKGKDVKPKKVSQGERNIIALCYFFTQILSNQDVARLYKNESFIIVDDPVSSFDFENKVGIISFLRLQISRIINGNQKSKVLILSHDLETVFNLRKALDEVCKATEGRKNCNPTTYKIWELIDGHLNPLAKKHGEYKELLKRVYCYAKGEANVDSTTIGNIMRRVLEAFSTFNYQKGIEQVSCDKNILKALDYHSVYFENLMYRLVLHGESHYEEQVNSIHDGNNFYEFISDEEKQKTARNILCFMHLLNPYHLIAYLKDEKNLIANVQQWIADIPKNPSFEADAP